MEKIKFGVTISKEVAEALRRKVGARGKLKGALSIAVENMIRDYVGMPKLGEVE